MKSHHLKINDPLLQSAASYSDRPLVIPALFNFVEAADTIVRIIVGPARGARPQSATVSLSTRHGGARLEGLLSSDSRMDNAVWLNCFPQVNQVCRSP